MSEISTDRPVTGILQRRGQRGPICAAGAVMLALAVPSMAAASVSGVYIGASAYDVELVQIIQTPDGRLAGRIEDVSLSKDGAIEDNSVAVDGAADGRQITLSPKSILMSGNAPSASGFIDGNLLDLSWQGGHRVLQRADAYAFEAAVSGLRARSAQIVADRDARNAATENAAKLQALFQSQQTLSDHLDQLDKISTSTTTYLSNVGDQYAGLARAAQHKRTQQRVFAATNGLGVASMSAGTDAQGLVIQMDGLHGQVNALRGQVASAVDQLRSQLSSIELACRELGYGAGGATAGPCRDLSGQKQEFTAKVAPLQSAFDGAEVAYQNAVAQANERQHLIRSLFQ